MTAGPLPHPPHDRSLPVGFRICLDPRVRRWADGSVLIGGAPWRISRIGPRVQDLVRRLVEAGSAGLVLESSIDLAAARLMLDRGFADPATPTTPGDDPDTNFVVDGPDTNFVVPAMDNPENLEQLLASLAPRRALVIDDGSRVPGSIARIAAAYGADLIVHDRNRGPAAARNTGMAATASTVVAFIDSDCLVAPDWPSTLLHHFADPAVAAVAPRVAPTDDHGRVLERYETTRSSLDMGRRPELVRPGARLGFVPSASLLVRRSALGDSGFDEDLRLGEDVDLVWRMAEAGWIVRYDPGTVVRHKSRTDPREWLVRRYEYGTSSPDLEDRHPGLLAPARVSSWNLATLALIGAARPILGTAITGAATGMLWRQVLDLPKGELLAARTVAQGLLADAAAIGQLLRREWWPIGAVALALSPRSRTARVAAACMLAPIAYEWATERPLLDPIRYTALRLIDDAAYGTGVLASSGRRRRVRTLLPEIRWPRLHSRPALPGPAETGAPLPAAEIQREPGTECPDLGYRA